MEKDSFIINIKTEDIYVGVVFGTKLTCSPTPYFARFLPSIQ